MSARKHAGAAKVPEWQTAVDDVSARKRARAALRGRMQSLPTYIPTYLTYLPESGEPLPNTITNVSGKPLPLVRCQ